MATSQLFSSLFLTATITSPTRLCHHHRHRRLPKFRINAAKIPAGVELPKELPKLQPPVAGFTRTAEVWNSRACMIGIISVFILELILNKGLLEIFGLEIGKGLDLPL
ncbi:light-harvesting complex-like protein OHP1, chloroplastic [Andrographis paniculata]|uniref:light-harvesting complex-like protein OHP1, chloroplastic n=1 Tax=Andrographis paniculata TaxID=175694 RepID=UPI0021E87A6B|nr:light-harvesting complex-like protein OHP1, chloroplastic [Andrographis paniculata]